MNSLDNIVYKIEDLVRRSLGNDPVHGYPHVERVMKLALKIANSYKDKVDMLALKLAVLLHDMGRLSVCSKDHHAVLSVKKATSILKTYNLPKSVIDKVVDAILAHSYTLNYKPKTIEGKILSDADKLDALGAIGIVRVFMLSAYEGRSIEESIKHFHDKILKLKDVMWTNEAKKIAYERHKFTVEFLKRLEVEVKGEV